MAAGMIDPAFYTAFIASRICHDLVSPASSVSSALEMLDDPSAGEEMRAASHSLLRDGARKMEASLLFLRYAFGSMGMSDSIADIHEARRVIDGYAALHKPHLSWEIDTAHFTYFHVRLVMHLLLFGITCLPRGGLITIRIKDQDGLPSIAVHCVARSDKPGIEAFVDLKQEIKAAISGEAEGHVWEPRTVQPLVAASVASQLGTKIVATPLSDKELIFAANRLAMTGNVDRTGLS